jgi:A/G-specific adenine glycosylase
VLGPRGAGGYHSTMDAAHVTQFRCDLLAWFDAHRRDLPWRRTRDPYYVWISEVMLQQTQVKTVVPYFERFVERYPDIRALARADLQDVLKSWEKMGYYARARNLHRAARYLVEHQGGEMPRDYASLRELPGVGEYIGSAVSSIAFGEPRAALDGNAKRVFARLFSIDTPFEGAATLRVLRHTADTLLDRDRAGDFNQAVMELGATVCKPTAPACADCPVVAHCGAFAAGSAETLPMKRARKTVPEYHIAVGVVSKDGRILITRRASAGLLGGLWEFPGGKVQPGETPEATCVREIGEEVSLAVEVTDYLTHVDHAYSHFKIGVDVYACRYRAGTVELRGPVDFRWILVDEIDDYPFPGANHKFIPLIKQRLK